MQRIDIFYLFILAAMSVFAIGMVLGPLFEVVWISHVFGIVAIVIAIYGLAKYGE